MSDIKNPILSTVVTLLIVLMLVLVPGAEAVSVSMSGLQAEPYIKGSSVNFTVSINISDPDRYVPISNISVNITGPDNISRTFALNGTPISGSELINVTRVSIPQPDQFGYGYGCDNLTGDCTGFGYGYGYGAGGVAIFRYNITVNTTTLPEGSYTALSSLNTGKAAKPSFNSEPATFEITALDTTPPEITNFTADPNTHISRSNPTIISADVTDSNLLLVDFMVVDINNLIRDNQTMLFRYTNESGISGKYRSLPWDGTIFDMINRDGTGNRTYITSMYVDNSSCPICQNTIMSPVNFTKNGTTEPVKAFAWFNRSTGNLSYLTLPLPEGGGDVEIEDGNSTISVVKLTFANGIYQSPVEYNSDDKTYIIYLIAGARSYLNPVLVSVQVPDGNYKILVHAVDTVGNDIGADSDIDTTPIGTTTTTTGSSGGSGSTGGGGVVTGEPYTNIEKAERYDKSLIANTPVTYAFKVPELGIYEIVVTGKESENDIAVRVEALKGTSKLVKEPAPGVVYRNVNVWAGTKRIKEVLIRFKVENSWIDSNSLADSEVRMVKWDGSKWVQLETAEKTKDSTYTYYEAKTDTLSEFAITGLKGGVMPTSTPATGVTETPVTKGTAATPTSAPTEKVPGFEIALAMAAISALYVLRKGKK